MPRAIRETERHRRTREEQAAMMAEQVLETVAVGEECVITKVNDRGNIVKRTPLAFTVVAKCSHSPNAGQWVCSTHGMTFTNQFCKDSHIHEGMHRLGWFCFECDNVQVP